MKWYNIKPGYLPWISNVINNSDCNFKYVYK